MVAEIKEALQADTSSNASTAGSVSSGTAAPPSQVAQEDTWQLFTYVGAGVQEDDLKEFIALDSASSIDLFTDRTLLDSIGPAPREHTVHTNGGPMKITLQGTLPA